MFPLVFPFVEFISVAEKQFLRPSPLPTSSCLFFVLSRNIPYDVEYQVIVHLAYWCFCVCCAFIVGRSYQYFKNDICCRFHKWPSFVFRSFSNFWEIYLQIHLNVYKSVCLCMYVYISCQCTIVKQPFNPWIKTMLCWYILYVLDVT